MIRFSVMVCLGAAVVSWVSAEACRAENVTLTYKKIKFDYVPQNDNGGITFGGDSTIPALPADFFGPGSEPFTGNVSLKGSKILQNLGVERTAGATFGTPSAPQDIPLEIVELNLASIQPILVTYSGGLTEQWDMAINLDKDETSSCWIRASHNPSGEPDGGTIVPLDSFFDIFAEVTFSYTPPGETTRYRGFAIIDRSHLTTSDAKWAHQNNNIADGADRDFIPGADPADPSAPLQVLFFDGGGLDLPLRVVGVGVPEPSTLLLAMACLVGLVAAQGRRQRLDR